MAGATLCCAWWFNPETHHYYLTTERGDMVHKRKQQQQQDCEQEQGGQDHQEQDHNLQQNNYDIESQPRKPQPQRTPSHHHLSSPTRADNNDNHHQIDVNNTVDDGVMMTNVVTVVSVGTNTSEESGVRSIIYGTKERNEKKLTVSGKAYIPVGSPGAKKIGGKAQRQGLEGGRWEGDQSNSSGNDVVVDHNGGDGMVYENQKEDVGFHDDDDDPSSGHSDIPYPTFISPW